MAQQLHCCRLQALTPLLVVVLLFACSALQSDAGRLPARSLAALVPEPPLVLQYHDGELLAGSGALNVYAIWYGAFSDADKAAVADFLSSLSSSSSNSKSPSVSGWWKVTSGYKDSAGASIFSSVRYAGQSSDPAASLGKDLKSADLESLVAKALSSGTFQADAKALYLVLTAADVNVEGFCVQSCASHRYFKAPANNLRLAYAWIGNSASRCAGKCAWPYANPKDFGGPDTAPLVAPNGAGIDGMIINIATEIAGATSNPFGTGYFQGPATAPLEAVTACPGIFGKGAYSGYPGQLLTDPKTGASFNAYGVKGREFLLPALWNPSTSACAYP